MNTELRLFGVYIHIYTTPSAGKKWFMFRYFGILKEMICDIGRLSIDIGPVSYQ
jgi:hypothetical protein